MSRQHVSKKPVGNAKSKRNQQVGWEATVPPAYRTEHLHSTTRRKSDNCQTQGKKEVPTVPAEEQGDVTTTATEQTKESGWRAETAVRSSMLFCLLVHLRTAETDCEPLA